MYIVTSIGIIHFGRELKTSYVILDIIISFIFLPGALLSIIGGFFGGISGEVIGSLITIVLLIFYVEKSNKIIR